MVNSSLRELYLDQLGDLCDIETQRILTLPRLAEAARTPGLRAALSRQILDARHHLDRLELIFTHWGEPGRSHGCAWLACLVQETDERLNGLTTPSIRDAAILGVARRLAHYALAAYGAARLYAHWLNRPDDIRLLDETVGEQVRADQQLADIAEVWISFDVTAA